MAESFFDQILFQARVRPPQHLAVATSSETVSYRQLANDIREMSSRLASRSLAENSLVAIDMEPSYVHLLVILALDLLDIPSTSISLSDEAAATWLLQQKRVVVVSSSAKPAGASISWITMSDRWDARDVAVDGKIDLECANASADALVRVVLSSGTTGAAKGIPFHRNVQIGRMKATAQILGLSHESRVFAVTFQRGGTLAALSVGALLVLANPSEVVDLVSKFSITHMTITPYWIDQLLTNTSGPGPRFPSICCLDVVGSPLPADMATQALALLTPNVFINYGTTEMGCLAFAHADIRALEPMAAGYPAPGVELEIIDDEGRPVPTGEAGRLRVRAPSAVMHYYGGEAEAAVSATGWFYCNDIASRDLSGLLFVEGRADEVINHGGLKISPFVIEEVLRSHPAVEDAVAFSAPASSGIMEPWAAVTGQIDAIDLEKLLVMVREKLGLCSLTRILRMRELPRNRNDKVLRRQLSVWVAEGRASNGAKA